MVHWYGPKLSNPGFKKLVEKEVIEQRFYQINVDQDGIHYWSQRDLAILLYSGDTKHNY